MVFARRVHRAFRVLTSLFAATVMWVSSNSSFAQCAPELYRLATPAGNTTFAGNTAQSFFGGVSTAANGLYNVNYNGVPFSLLIATLAPGVTNFNLNSPLLGFTNQSVIGGSQAGSAAALQSLFASSSINSRIMKLQVANSPNNAIAGPGGLIPTMAASSFNDNFNEAASHIAAPQSMATADGRLSNPNMFGVGLSYGIQRVHDCNSSLAQLPLSYTMRNDLDPRRQIVFSVPLSRLDVSGAVAYGGGLGAAYRIPMNDSWTLTPGVKLGMTAARDLNTLVSVASSTLTSTYIWIMDGFDVSMANQIGYYQSVKLFGGDYSADAGVRSFSLRNGLMFTQPVTVNGQKMSLEYSLIDTRYMGTKFYVDNTQELSITLGTNKRAYSARSFFRGGLTLIHGKDTKGITANIGYWF